jgi:hypothetical protein
MPVTTWPSQRKRLCPMGTRNTKMAKASCRPSPHPTTRQRMARRLWERAMPRARMREIPMSPVNRLSGEW